MVESIVKSIGAYSCSGRHVSNLAFTRTKTSVNGDGRGELGRLSGVVALLLAYVHFN